MKTNEIRNPLFYIKVKKEAFNDPTTPFVKEKFDPETEYPVVCIVGDRLVVVIENGELIELYPRKCLFAGSPD